MKAVTADVLKMWGNIYSIRKNSFPQGRGSSKINASYFTIEKTEIIEMKANRLMDGTNAIRVNDKFDFPIGTFGPTDIVETEDSFLKKHFAHEEDAQSIARMLTEVELNKISAVIEEETEKLKNLTEIQTSLNQQMQHNGLGFND